MKAGGRPASGTSSYIRLLVLVQSRKCHGGYISLSTTTPDAAGRNPSTDGGRAAPIEEILGSNWPTWLVYVSYDDMVWWVWPSGAVGLGRISKRLHAYVDRISRPLAVPAADNRRRRPHGLGLASIVVTSLQCGTLALEWNRSGKLRDGRRLSLSLSLSLEHTSHIIWSCAKQSRTKCQLSLASTYIISSLSCSVWDERLDSFELRLIVNVTSRSPVGATLPSPDNERQWWYTGETCITEENCTYPRITYKEL